MSAKKLDDFLPGPVDGQGTDTRLAQARIPKELHDAVKAQIAKDRKDKIPMDWQTLITAACRAYLSTRGAKKVP